MPAPRVRLPDAPLPDSAWSALRAELEVPAAFPADVLAEAERSAAAPRLPALDRTAVPLLTIDPEGSRDLDQALSLERTAAGYRLHYAIADVGAFVVPGGPLEAECRRRGVTLYLPDGRAPLHPPVLGESAASLLPDVDRPALLWTVDLDVDGTPGEPRVERALVRSRQRLSYREAQDALDGGAAPEPLALLREVGLLLQARARDRGAVDLPVPEQEVTDGRLVLRAPLPVEGWNAQLSLLTGRQAARLVLASGTGLLRTLPPPAPEDVASLRRSALALGVDWPQDAGWGRVVSGLDARVPAHAAVLSLATRLLRGAGYAALDGPPVPEPPPAELVHSAVAAAYAHCTAPLRRLADRYVLDACVAAVQGQPAPEHVRAALPELPALMTAAGRRASAVDRAVVDLAEALVLAPRVGEAFDGAVVEAGPKGGAVQLLDPPVRAPLDGPDLPLGAQVRVRLVEADPARRRVRFALADQAG